jgi:hypothetical protein
MSDLVVQQIWGGLLISVALLLCSGALWICGCCMSDDDSVGEEELVAQQQRQALVSERLLPQSVAQQQRQAVVSERLLPLSLPNESVFPVSLSIGGAWTHEDHLRVAMSRLPQTALSPLSGRRGVALR